MKQKYGYSQCTPKSLDQTEAGYAFVLVDDFGLFYDEVDS
jgi:hypothetical protein